MSESLELLSSSVLADRTRPHTQALEWTHNSLFQTGVVPGKTRAGKVFPEGVALLVLESSKPHLGPEHLKG